MGNTISVLLTVVATVTRMNGIVITADTATNRRRMRRILHGGMTVIVNGKHLELPPDATTADLYRAAEIKTTDVIWKQDGVLPVGDNLQIADSGIGSEMKLTVLSNPPNVLFLKQMLKHSGNPHSLNTEFAEIVRACEQHLALSPGWAPALYALCNVKLLCSLPRVTCDAFDNIIEIAIEIAIPEHFSRTGWVLTLNPLPKTVRKVTFLRVKEGGVRRVDLSDLQDHDQLEIVQLDDLKIWNIDFAELDGSYVRELSLSWNVLGEQTNFDALRRTRVESLDLRDNARFNLRQIDLQKWKCDSREQMTKLTVLIDLEWIEGVPPSFMTEYTRIHKQLCLELKDK